jgi:transcriptional regulator with XRE-family HTH domain
MLVDAPDSTYTHPGDCFEMADAVENGTAPIPFNEALRTALHSKRMSQKELARRTRRSPAAVNQWLHGKDIPDVDIVMIIEEHLELSRGTLVYLVESKGWTHNVHPGNPKLGEELNSALVRDTRLTDDQKASVRELVETYVKLNELMDGRVDSEA